MQVLFLYTPIRSTPKHRGLAEQVVRKRLETQGWLVWRSSLINITRSEDVYSRVLRKYLLLEELLERHNPGSIEELRYLNEVHHGMPDFLCFRRGGFLFVECKFCNEQLTIGQKKCIPKLIALGFPVEVHKIVSHTTKVRKAIVDLESGEKFVMEKQLRLKRKY